MDGLLFVVLTKELNCYHIDKLEYEIVTCDRKFTAFNDDDFSGFYDWLRDATGNVIGIRYSVLDKFKPALIKALKKQSYVRCIHEKIVEIYFYSDKRSIDDNTSNDQDFGVCKVYKSSDSTFAILFDIEYLTANEFLSIATS